MNTPRALLALLLGAGCSGAIGNPYQESRIASRSPEGEIPGAAPPDVPPTPSQTAPAPPPPNTTVILPDSACSNATPGPRLLRRLTNDEYANTVADLLGVDATAQARAFVAPALAHGYTNNALALQVDPLLADELSNAAEDLAKAAQSKLDALSPCHEKTATCARAFITSFGRRAYRRPLTAAEIERHLAVYNTGSEDGGGHAGGLGLVVTAMLQAPSFLYRSELGAVNANGDATLSAHEVATQLSYLFTASTPDTVLSAAADANQLSTDAQITSQARRLLSTSRGQKTLSRFVTAWLELDRIKTLPKDAATFPDFKPSTRQAMLTEISHFAEDAQGSTLQALLSSPDTFVDAELAAIYGLPAPASNDFTRVRAAGAGVLTRAAVMAVHAAPGRSSPVHRGRLVRERFLCQSVPPPPANVDATLPLDTTLPLRKRLEKHTANPRCAGCHRLLDPTGFALEAFDGIGRSRDAEFGAPIDTTGALNDFDGTDVALAGADQLAERLAKSPTAIRCVGTQWFTFATGLAPDEAGRCQAAALAQKFASASSFADLFIATATQDHLRHRR